MPTMEQIQQEIANILHLAEDELTPEQQAAIDSYLDELGKQESDKIDAFAGFVREQNARADFIAEEAKKMTAKAKAITNRVNSIKQFYLDLMRVNGLNKVQGKLYSLSVRRSEAVSVTALVDKLPDEYKRVKTSVEADKTAIKEAIVQGREVPGCEIVETYSLQVK